LTLMPSPLAWGGVVIFAYSIWLGFLEGRGILVYEQKLSIPTRPLRRLPIFTASRVHFPVQEVWDITYAGSWIGMEHVLLNASRPDSQQLLFHTRAARRFFFEIMKLKVPTIRIYRRQ